MVINSAKRTTLQRTFPAHHVLSLLFFAVEGYNATFPRENTVDEANAWYNRWQAFKEKPIRGQRGECCREMGLFWLAEPKTPLNPKNR